MTMTLKRGLAFLRVVSQKMLVAGKHNRGTRTKLLAADQIDDHRFFNENMSKFNENSNSQFMRAY